MSVARGFNKKQVNAMRKAIIESVVFQRQLQERMYLDAFGEPMEEAIKRRFKDRHIIL